MKYIKLYQEENDQKNLDILYLSRMQGSKDISYIKETIDHYKMTTGQIHNLQLAVEYNYLPREDFRNVVNEIINSQDVWHYLESEKMFKIAYEKNFKTKIKKIKKPYPICYITWNKYKLDPIQYNDLNSFDYNDIIGEIPAEYPFEKKYLVGKGRYRSKSNDDNKTLWEKFRNTNRESEFIEVIDEKNLYILTKTDIDKIEIITNANKYNL